MIDPAAYGPGLLPQHAAMLAQSAIAPEVAAERGYRSIESRDELARLGFRSQQQNVPALLLPVHNVQGQVMLHQSRPDLPRYNDQGKPVKYETPAGGRMLVDVPPRARPRLSDPTFPLLITEGIKKGDAAVSAGLCCVSLLGVFNFRGTNRQGGKTALPDWEAIALNGRTVYIVFDSDVMVKPPVHEALARLMALLDSRGSTALVIYLPVGDGGAKVGLDDFLAAGHTVEELLALAVHELRPLEGSEKQQPQAARLVQLAEAGGVELFHDPEMTPYASFPVNGHRENARLNGKDFRLWLAERFYRETGGAPGGEALQTALGILAGKARYDGPEHPVAIRLARHGDAIYLDLTNAAWQAVKITRDGWELVESGDCPVRFRRAKGALPMPMPEQDGTLDELWRFVNVRPGADRALLAGYLITIFWPEGPYPVLVLTGEQGTAKSGAQRVIRLLVDPNSTPLRTQPRDAHTAMIAAANSWMLPLDNLSYVSQWLSDLICCLSTGGGYSTRELFSDGEETLFNATRPVTISSIEDITTRGDLLDRAIVLALQVIPEDQRRAESELWADFERVRPRILGALLNGVATALRRLPHTKLERLPRMADFALRATAAEPGLGLSAGAFMAAYSGNRAEASNVALEADPVADKLLAFMSDREDWEGTATNLLTELEQLAGYDKEPKGRPDGWPKRADKLSGQLTRLAPNLRKLGIDVRARKTNGRRFLRLDRQSGATSATSATDQAENGANTPNRAGVESGATSGAPAESGATQESSATLSPAISGVQGASGASGATMPGHSNGHSENGASLNGGSATSRKVCACGDTSCPGLPCVNPLRNPRYGETRGAQVVQP